MNDASRYDAIIVLGSAPDTQNWQFPSHVFKSLDCAAELLAQKIAPYILLSGDHALSFDHADQHQPFKECDEMAAYLLAKGVDGNALLLEGESRDTLTNLYDLKKHFLEPRNMRRILIITGDFRLPRLQFLSQKILGDSFWIEFQVVPSASGEAYPNEAETLAKQQKFLRDMPDGDDSHLKNAFYNDPYYRALYKKRTRN